MSRTVLQKEQLFHAQSRSPSLSSESSGFSFSFALPSELVDASISSPDWWASNQEDRVENITNRTSRILVKKDQPRYSVDSSSPKTAVASRALKAEVPELRFHHRGAAEDSSKNSPGKHQLESPNWPDYAMQESYPLPLPPGTSFKWPPVSGAERSPAAASNTP